MMKKLAAVLGSFVLALLLAACGDGSRAFVGSWQVDAEAMRDMVERTMADQEPDPSEPPGMAQMRKDMMETMIANMKMDLTINDDNTFTMVMTMMGGPQTRTGEWSISGDTITMTDDQGETVTGTIVDGSLVIEGEGGGDGGPEELRFKRAAG